MCGIKTIVNFLQYEENISIAISIYCINYKEDAY